MNITIFKTYFILWCGQRCFCEAPYWIKAEEHVHQQSAPCSRETKQSAKKGKKSNCGTALTQGHTGHMGFRKEAQDMRLEIQGSEVW